MFRYQAEVTEWLAWPLKGYIGVSTGTDFGRSDALASCQNADEGTSLLPYDGTDTYLQPLLKDNLINGNTGYYLAGQSLNPDYDVTL